MKDDKFTSIIDWSESSHINKYDSINKLRLKKIKATLQFYINDHFIKDAPFEQFLGQKIGFRLVNKIAIDIKRISIRQSQ